MTRTRFYFSLASTFLIDTADLFDISTHSRVALYTIVDNSLPRPWHQYPSAMGIQWFHTIVQVCPVFATMAFTTIIYIRLLFILHNLRNVEPVHVTLRYVRNPTTESGSENRRHDGHQPENAHIDPARDANMNLGRPSKKNFKGFFTILLLTGSFYIVWAPYAISYVTQLHPTFQRIFYNLRLCMTSVQPLVYLVTNSEARKLCLTSLRQCLNQLTRKTNSRDWASLMFLARLR